MYYGDQVASVPNKLKKDVVPRKTRSLTIAEELVVGPAVEDPSVQSLLDLRNGSKASRLESLRQKKQPDAGEGSSAAHNKYYDSSDTNSDATLYSSSSDESEESENETDDTDEPDMDLFNDNSNRDDDAAGLAQDLPPVYIGAQTTLVVHNPEGNPELTSYISGASEVPLANKIPYPTTTPQPSSLEAKAKKLMQKGKKNMRKINFKKIVAKKFREYDQKLEALTNFNVSESFEKAVQAKVLIEIKKLLPTYIPKAIANYVRPLLNTSVLDVMKNNQISLFTKPSTTTDDLSEMDLKLRLLNRIHLNKSNETYTTHQQLYDTFYDSVTLDQDALNALDAEPSFHKRTYDNQDPPNNREGENMKKRRKNVGEPSSKSSRRKKSPVIHAQDDTHAIQPVDQEDEYIRTHSNSKWYTKSGSTNVVRKITWFDLLLKLGIEQNENHIFGPSTVAIAKKLKSIIKNDELTIADFKGAGLERLKQQYQNDVELEYHVDQLKAVVLSEAKWNSDENDVSKSRMFERHMSKNTKPRPSFYNNDFDYLVILSTEEKYTTSLTSTMMQDTINKEDKRIDFFKAEMSTRTEGNVYSGLRIKSVVRIMFSYADLPILSLNDVGDMYLLQVQDKLHHLILEFVKDCNNALLLFIRKVVIQNRVEDIQLGVESYQQTLNLTEPMLFYEGIDQWIPFTMTTMHKGIVYLNQHNIKSLMRLMGKDNKRLKGRDWTDNDVMKSNKIMRKIDQTLKRKEQLRRLEEYVGRRPKTVNPRTFVRPM
ncbi:hypothetical protein Tco_0771053 [Tanacetum coccineum]|uniref:Uncharacterized protein n=1 Tax=Tanacetum coccineum TaxID=301880 RepID=A0ABQ4ZGU0_9ASTR